MFTRSLPPTLSPIYLLPSSPFRRKVNVDSAKSARITKSVTFTKSTGELLESQFNHHTSHLRCAKCANDICLTSQIISKGFTGRHGRAYLVSPSPLLTESSQSSKWSEGFCLPNTKTDPPSSRQLVTGAHTVSDVRCAFCSSVLGWKYDEAEEESQHYKVGKYILETKMICSSSNWENEEAGMPLVSLDARNSRHASAEESIEFDSQDEDECEDLFAGIWTASLAAKRRQSRCFRSVLPGNPPEIISKR